MSDRVRALLEAMPAGELDALARRYAADLAADGLTVHRAGESPEWLPIPPLLTPKILSRAALDAMGQTARALTSALVRLTGYLCGETASAGERALAEQIWAGLGPLEREFHAADLGRLATVRVDHFVDRGVPRALEVNATIPAMQGYSDLIARRFIAALAPTPAHAARALALNGDNSADLLAAVLHHARALGAPADRPLVIAIVSRRGDAQLGELLYYQRAFSAAGHAAEHVYVDEVTLESGEAHARGRRLDVIYRHIFARRVDPASAFATILRAPARHRVLNPIASPLEVKAMLGLLSEIAPDDARAAAVGLTDSERAATQQAVPWTRVLTAGPTSGPDGEAIADLPAWVRAHAAALVLKKSWDYGGKRVFLGIDVAGHPARLIDFTGTRPPTWDGLIDTIMGGPDLWVVQRLVPSSPERHLVASANAPPEWRDLHVDVSAYASLDAPAPRGGVCRASASRIVNILGGGGLAPTLTDEALAALLE